MGKYFRISMRYNKNTPHDFGLIESDDGSIFISPEDSTLWAPCNLYDFGWGEEMGYYRLPLPGYDELLQIVIESEEQDDVYGAAAIILKTYPEQLLLFCENQLHNQYSQRVINKLVSVFQLEDGKNRSSIVGKTYVQISDDAKRWNALAQSLTSE